MLARSAQGLYWMGRYLERAEHLCQMLQLQTEALVDRPLREIHFGWRRIYDSLDRLPPGGALVPITDDDYALADSYTLADDLTFDWDNPDSVRSCISLGRENARQMRHCISAEMWTCLNLAYLRIRDTDITDIWRNSPENFYAQTASEIATLTGIAEATMYRDVGWRFMQLGRFIERSQISCELFLIQTAADTLDKEDAEADWTSLLRVYHAVEAYNRTYSVEVHPAQVLDLLVTDPLLPGSLRRSLERSESGLAAIGHGPNELSSAAAQRLAGRARALIHYDWPDTEDREDLLTRALEYSREMHHLVSVAYFDYPLEEAGD